MPELPEVETLKNSLQNKLIDRLITNVTLRRSDLRYSFAGNLAEQMLLAKILDVKRIAKYLIIELDNGYSLAVHLGMSGRFTMQPASYPVQKHDHVILELNEGQKLVFNDARRFGMIYSFPSEMLFEQKIFSNLGFEPLSSEFTPASLKLKLAGRLLPVKNALMDNNCIVGVGNIYSSESLFLSAIHPRRPAGSLDDEELGRLVSSIKQVLTKAIAAGGTTLRDFINGDSRAGYFSQELLVYGRAGQKCYKCSDNILKIRQSNRASFYCPTCQPFAIG